MAALNARAQRYVLALFGLVLLRLGTSDLLLRFVRPGTRPLVLAAGAVVLLAAMLPARDQHGSRLVWLALLPVAAVLVIGPPALGAYTANRRIAPLRPAAHPFADLPRGTVSLSVVEFALRSLDRHGATLAGHTVRLTGFVARTTGTGVVLARLVITCCAADAEAVEVAVRTRARPAANAWVGVTGRYVGQAANGRPVVVATAVQDVAAPADPYDR